MHGWRRCNGSASARPAARRLGTFETLTEQGAGQSRIATAERRCMGLFGWWKGKPDNGELRAWRDEWARAVASLDAGALAPLEAALRRQPPIADDVEMEEEMLDGLRQLIAIERELGAARLPLVETTHRVVGTDRCHFSAPVSLPDDPAQPTGRLLLTSARAAFAGGARTVPLPWHAVREVMQGGRDVIFVTSRAGDGDGQRFRCNSYAEALCGAAIARFLMRQSRGARL